MSETAPPLPAEIILLEGPDAGSFMHGQFTTNVLALREGQWHFSAWLDAQGRVRALFHVARLAEDRWALLLRGGKSESLVAELARYVFRARVRMRALEASSLRMEAAANLYVAKEVGDSLHLGCGDHRIASGKNNATDDGLREAQIRHGWPWLPTGALGRYTAAALALHHLGAIALDKGCYPGQEIVARLHYRGGNKRRLCRVILSQHVSPDAELQRADDGASLHVLDVAREGTAYHALVVAHDSWLVVPHDVSTMLCTDGTRVQIVEAWDE